MIRCDLATAVAFFFVLMSIGLFCIWFFDIIRRKFLNDADKGRVSQCPYCGNMMLDYLNKNIVICSVCHSYLEVRDENSGKKK